MKSFALIATFLVTTGIAWALGDATFTSWNFLIEHSPDIVIARCATAEDGLKPQPTRLFSNASYSDIEVISVLKGNTVPGVSHLISLSCPFRDEQFLVFADYESNHVYAGYKAIADYRLIPINVAANGWWTNQLAGKTLKEQVQMIINWRLTELNNEMERDYEEMTRLKLDFSTQAPLPPAPPVNSGTKF